MCYMEAKHWKYNKLWSIVFYNSLIKMNVFVLMFCIIFWNNSKFNSRFKVLLGMVSNNMYVFSSASCWGIIDGSACCESPEGMFLRVLSGAQT